MTVDSSGQSSSRTCQRCGRTLLAGEARYEVDIVVRAAYDPLEITEEELSQDHDLDIRRALDELRDLTEKEAMDQVYRRFRFELCRPCQRVYLRDPLPRAHRES